MEKGRRKRGGGRPVSGLKTVHIAAVPKKNEKLGLFFHVIKLYYMARRTPHVSKAFKKLRIADKIVFGENVHDRMSSNDKLFATPKVPLTSIKTYTDDLKTAAAKAESGAHLDHLTLVTAEKNWDNGFDLQAEYVDGVANGDTTIIEKSGFESTKSVIVPTTVPGVVAIKSIGSKGQEQHIYIDLEGDENERNYIVVFSSDAKLPVITNGLFLIANNPSAVAVFVEKHVKMDVHGLPSGANLFVSIVAYNHKGFGVFSQPVSVKVL